MSVALSLSLVPSYCLSLTHSRSNLWRYFGSSCELEPTQSDPHQAPQRRELEVKRSHPNSAVNSSSLRSASITLATHSRGLGSASITRPCTLHIASTADLTLATSQSP